MYREQIEAYFADKQEEILADICRLIRIKSERGEPREGMPFGEGPYAALKEGEAMLREKGFAPKNFDNYVISAELNDKPAYLGILAHRDVVSEGSGWTFPPYEGTVKDGRLYGRGSADDKGPAVVALWAMKAAREIEPNLSRGARLILGSAEETGSEDLEHYLPLEPAPPVSFSPDAEYPVINIEKGGHRPIFGADWAEDPALPRVTEIHGGSTVNIVPLESDAWVEGLALETILEHCARESKKTGVQFGAVEEGGLIHIHALGESAHAASPEGGKNAQTALLALLASLPLAPSAGQKAICDLSRLFPYGDNHGTALGVDQEDAISGRLTLVFSKLTFTKTGFEGQYDSRCPICATNDNMRAVSEKNLNACGFTFRKKPDMYAPHHTSAESDLCQTLLRTYEDYTGQKGECVAIGGGTYVHDIEGGVAFGCAMPGTDNRMHGADEFAVIDELMVSAKMFTQVILDLCK